jgi:hypothetical protein
MPQNSIPIFVARRQIFLAIALTTLIASLASAAHAQSTTWVVTIDLTKAATKLKPSDYKLACESHLGTPFIPCPGGQTDPTYITIALGDTVLWQTKSASNDTETWIVHEDAVLDDGSSGPATHHHHGYNRDPIGGVTDSTATDSATPHEYYVFVIDNATQKAYFGDPKYIIGGGLAKACKDFIREFDKDPQAKKVIAACNDALEEKSKFR